MEDHSKRELHSAQERLLKALDGVELPDPTSGILRSLIPRQTQEAEPLQSPVPDVPPPPSRLPRGRKSFYASDLVLAAELNRRTAAGETQGEAAIQLAEQAEGGGTRDSRAERLKRRARELRRRTT